MPFAIPTTNSVSPYRIKGYQHDTCVSATNVRIPAGCFVAETTAGSNYYHVARDDLNCEVAGVCRHYINNTNTSDSYPFTEINVWDDCEGLFPVSTTTASVAGTPLYVDSAQNGNVLTHVAGNEQVGVTKWPCYNQAEPSATHTGYIWAYINPKSFK